MKQPSLLTWLSQILIVIAGLKYLSFCLQYPFEGIDEANVFGHAAYQDDVLLYPHSAYHGTDPIGYSIMDSLGDIRVGGFGMDQGDHLGFGKNNTLGIHRYILCFLQRLCGENYMQ